MQIEEKEEFEIKDLIYQVRGKQVMLDSDVAKQYDYDTKRINENVKRNIKRFPVSFCFRLTAEEYSEILKIRNGAFEIENSQKETLDPSKSQIATAPNKRNIRYLPYVFTEQGIAMLSGLLKSDIAIEVSIKIMNAFVEMRKFIINNAVIFEKIHSHELKILEHDDKFEKVFNELQKEENIKQKIFYNGQIYDAYKGLIKIIKQAKNELVIIDNYLDDSILEVILNKNSDVSVIIITNQKTCKLLTQDIEKFNKQYSKITIKYSEDFHDRFIIIDKKIIYHCGASLKDLGNKTFAINEMYDKSLLKKILEL